MFVQIVSFSGRIKVYLLVSSLGGPLFSVVSRGIIGKKMVVRMAGVVSPMGNVSQSFLSKFFKNFFHSFFFFCQGGGWEEEGIRVEGRGLC